MGCGPPLIGVSSLLETRLFLCFQSARREWANCTNWMKQRLQGLGNATSVSQRQTDLHRQEGSPGWEWQAIGGSRPWLSLDACGSAWTFPRDCFLGVFLFSKKMFTKWRAALGASGLATVMTAVRRMTIFLCMALSEGLGTQRNYYLLPPVLTILSS